MLKDVKKNNEHFYYKDDVENLGLPLYNLSDVPSSKGMFSKSWLKKELTIKLTEEQENNPHAFAQGKNGYYPIWDVEKIN